MSAPVHASRSTDAAGTVQVHAQAKARGADVAAHYVIKDVTRLASQGYYADAALAMHAHGAPPDAAHAPLYARIAAGVLAAPEPRRNTEAEAALKAALFDVYSVLRVRCISCLAFHTCAACDAGP